MSEAPQLRILFLDDDEHRASVFIEEHPTAVWVRSVEECIGLLDQDWNVIHLDHDLGGEQYVDSDRPDCGMEVVRHIISRPYDNLRRTIFIVHTHNPEAGERMRDALLAAGYDATYQPYGRP